jgi:hypothetical protein
LAKVLARDFRARATIYIYTRRDRSNTNASALHLCSVVCLQPRNMAGSFEDAYGVLRKYNNYATQE